MTGVRKEIASTTAAGILTIHSGALCPAEQRDLDHMASIAIYESDDLMKSLLVEWLSQVGYSVQEPAAAERNRAADLIIVSIQKPKHEGVGVIRAMRMIHPRTPFIALSSQFRSGLSPVGTAAQALGVMRVLAKPLTRNELLAAVQAVIGPPGRQL
jgi:DNA-binding response OmpR family regulator